MNDTKGTALQTPNLSFSLRQPILIIYLIIVYLYILVLIDIYLLINLEDKTKEFKGLQLITSFILKGIPMKIFHILFNSHPPHPKLKVSSSLNPLGKECLPCWVSLSLSCRMKITIEAGTNNFDPSTSRIGTILRKPASVRLQCQ